MKVRDVMTTQVATVTEDTPVQAAAALMLEQGVSGVPVVDGEGRLRGIVSEGDLMRRAETHTDVRRRSWWLRLLGSEESEARDYVKTHGRRVGDVMSRQVVTARLDDDIAEVAMALEKHRIKRVPVLVDGKVAGIVSRADLLRGLAAHGALGSPEPTSDREIRDALVAHVAEQPWATGALVNVIVTEGTVHLWGFYDSKEQHQALLVAARNAPGVRGVEDHMSASQPAWG